MRNQDCCTRSLWRAGVVPGVYIWSTQLFVCWAGDRIPPVLESSEPTAGPGKPLSSMGRGTIVHNMVRVLLWSGRSSNWDLHVSEHELGMRGMKFDSPELC